MLVWNDKAAELGVHPRAVALHDWVQPHPKPAALDDLAAGVLAAPGSRAPNPASLSLLRRDDPRFTPGGGPPGGVFSDDLDAMCGWVRHLDGSCISIQGPPGTGKTYWGAHLVHGLVGAGRRVGITAMSHHAIDNLLEEILAVFEDEGERSRLEAVRKVPDATHPRLPGVTYVTGNAPCAKSDYNLVAGTTWLFAGPDLQGAPVDVLIVDEAGQLALADALAASSSAKNVVLLGDPLQLPQVAQALHPGSGGLERPAARARGRRDDAAGPWGLPDRDQAHAPRRVPVHLGGDLRGAAREPSGLRPAGTQSSGRGCAGSSRPRRVLDRVPRGDRARGR